MLGEEFGHLGLDRLGQQGARSVAQHLGKRVGERPWLKQLDDVSIGHGVSLLGWRSGGANTPTIRRLHPVSPSPTFAHSSLAPLVHPNVESVGVVDLFAPVTASPCTTSTGVTLPLS